MERRAWERKEKNIKCWINAFHYNTDGSVECETKDLSLGGAFLVTPVKLPKNHLIEIKFSSAISSHTNHYSLFGYVVREEDGGSAFEVRRASKLTMHRLNELLRD